MKRPNMSIYLSTVGLLMVVVACVTSGAASAQEVMLEEVATGLRQPVSITHANDGSGRVFVTQQGGTVVILEGGQQLEVPFLDVTELTQARGEQGLLSVAFHPDYAQNGLFFVNYTDRQGDTVVARYSVSDDPNVADAGSAVVMLNIEQPRANHNGGQLQFGPDGYLYIGMGDSGGGGDPDNDAQDLGTLLGTLLRLDVDNVADGEAYGVPDDNPFVGDDEVRDEIWAYGLRNPWRFSFDRDTGDLFIADVGQSAIEEVNFQSADSSGGENYGWRFMEGSQCFNPSSGCEDESFVMPILEYTHASGDGRSITGGYRYRGESVPALSGAYVYGDFVSGRIWRATEEAGAWTSELLMEANFPVVTFGQDEVGELYVADYNGVLYRFAAEGAQAGN